MGTPKAEEAATETADLCLTALIMWAGEKEKMPGVWAGTPGVVTGMCGAAGRAGGEAVIPTGT